MFETTYKRAVLAAVLGLGANTAAALELTESMDGEGIYTVPVRDAAREQYATFFVQNYEVRLSDIDDDTSPRVMTFDLPLDLAGGRKEQIRLVETEIVGNVVKLVGPKARAECRGEDESDWDDLACRFYFQGLWIQESAENRDEALSYVAKKYAGTARAAGRRDVIIDFLYEPIGDVATMAVDADCERCSMGNGEWRVTYQSPQGQWVDAQMFLERQEGWYYTPSGSGQLSHVAYHGDEATGLWRYGNATGWFRFSFNGDEFAGEWGYGGVVGQQRRGEWNGAREPE